MIIPLGTLADNALIATPVADSVSDRTYVSSVEAVYTLREVAAAADTPIVVGFAHSNYTGAEIEEYLENANAWDEGDLVAQEQNRRQIVIVGTFAVLGTGNQTLNDGKPIKKKAKGMILKEGQQIDFWAWNKSGNQLTTGADFVINGHANLWPN